MKNTRNVVNLAVVRDQKLLLGLKKDGQGDVFTPLGGKRLEGETDKQCLQRELSDEIKGNVASLLLSRAEYVGYFEGRMPHTHNSIQVDLYFTSVGHLKLEPDHEIMQLREFYFEDIQEEPRIPAITRRMAKTLKDLNIIF